MSDIVFLVRPCGKVLEVNRCACQRLGFRRKTIIGTNLSEVELSSGVREVITRASLGPWSGPVTCRTVLRRKHQPGLPVEIVVTHLEIGSEPYWLLVVRDTTKNMDREEAQQLFIQLASHDLLGSLSIITGFSEFLDEDGLNFDADQKRAVELIREAAQQMKEYLSFADSLARGRLSGFKAQPVSLDLLKVVDEVLIELREDITDKDMSVIVQNHLADKIETGFPVVGIKNLIRVMVTNLIKNAIEAAPAASEVHVNLCEGGDGKWSLIIHNQGMIPLEIQECLFEKYTSAGKNKGTGLGAFSARHIARLHGGDIDFITSAEHGTTVTVWGPLDHNPR